MGARRHLFTITTGRSGTEWLARVLGLFSDVRAEHEPKPRFSSCFRAVVAAPQVAREFWEKEKLPRLARVTKPIYAETSHLACKGFLECLPALGVVPELVHLRRDPRAVARSLWSLESIPGRSLRGVRYYLSPWDPNHLPVEPSRAERWSDYQLCYWYCLEIDARARHLERVLAPHGTRVHRVELAELQTPAGIAALGEKLALGPLSTLGKLKLAALAARPVNEKKHLKRAETLPEAELDAWEAEVRDYSRT